MLAAAAVLAAAPPVPAVAAEKRALLIGIDQYPSPEVDDLHGAVNDVALMESVLAARLEIPPQNLRVLLNAQATRAGILTAIREHLIAPTQPGDVVILHYAGHGSRAKDDSDDELDDWDETIVPHDGRLGDVRDISDDELNGLLQEISQKTPNVTLIFDSCNSGTVSRALESGAVARQAPDDTRPPLPPPAGALGARGLVEGPSDFALPSANYVLVSGARADERAYELGEAPTRHGALSFYLAEALRSAPAEATWRDVMDRVGASVTARFAAQHPQLEGARLDTVLFGDSSSVPDPHVLVEPLPDGTVRVAGGTSIGLSPDLELAVYPAGTKRFAPPAAPSGKVALTTVGPFESTARVVSGGPIAEHSRAALSVLRPPGHRLGIFVELPGSPLLTAARAKLATYDVVDLDATESEAQVRLREGGGRVELLGRDQQLLGAVRSADADAVASLTKLVTHWARWYGILALANPNPALDVDLRLARVGDPAAAPPPTELEAGSQLGVTVNNRSGQKLYVVIVALAEDGSISSLPASGAAFELQGTNPLRRVFTASVPANRESSRDVVKVIAATQPIPADVFKQDPLPLEEARGARAAGDDALSALLRGTNIGLSRDLDPVEVEEWTTRQTPLRVVHRTTRAPALALHFDSPSTAGNVRAAGGARALGGDPGTVIFDAAAPAGVGQAFQQAYERAASSGAARGEPLLDVELPATELPSKRARSAGSGDDPRADADPLWNLKQTRVPEAWQTIRGARSVPAGAEARGVVIAHPDTGYRPHPEIWSDDAATRSVWSEVGWDYYGDDTDATDDLLDTQPIDNPAHGTGSGSAIVSPAGSQTANYSKGATGPAQGARLVPLRVNRSVVHFNTERLSQAILDAAGDDRSHVRARTDLMSISMGGVPSWTLWKAVTEAEARGYLIIAAAGNYVRTVVWPARFDSVLAVAATNVGCQPWSHTSRGAAVDVSAPGESVWRAMLDGNEYITSMGTGTTYATATTAGIAALWFAYHRGTPAFEQLAQQHDVARTFRYLVQTTAWRPDDTPPAGVQCDQAAWRRDAMGAGIVDGAALIAAPLAPPPVPRSPRAATLDDLPLFASLYPGEPATEVVRADYRRLFRDAALAEVAGYESEVTYHYAVSQDVTAAADNIVVRQDRSPAAFDRLREVLLAQDLSPRLRGALQ